MRLVFLFSSLYLLAGCAQSHYSAEQSQRLLGVYSTPERGRTDAKVEVIQFSAFSCSHCKDAAIALRELVNEQPTLLRIRFKPMAYSNDLAGKQAAKAALAASLQGKFWEMSDLLFENQDKLDDALYPRLATQLQLNEKQFAADFTSPFLERAVELNTQEAASLGVRGTPTFFMKQHAVEGFKSKAEFRKYVQAVAAGKDPNPKQKKK